ncbi:hypothetical protein BJV77DRAFT_49394, partial [Russula vinacea]
VISSPLSHLRTRNVHSRFPHRSPRRHGPHSRPRHLLLPPKLHLPRHVRPHPHLPTTPPIHHPHLRLQAQPPQRPLLKWSWAWTTLAFVLLLFTSSVKRQRTRRLLQWAFASGAWFILTSWFFGPSLLARLTAASGGECGLHIGSAFVPISQTYCSMRIPVSRATHPELFPAVFEGPEALSSDTLIPKLRRAMTYQDMSFYSPSPSSFWRINYAKRVRLRIAMQLPRAERYYRYGYSHCGLRVYIFMRPPKKYQVLFWGSCASCFLRYLCGSLPSPKTQLYDTFNCNDEIF